MAAREEEKPASPFPRLTAQAARAMGPGRAAAHQRGRLEGAMVAAVERGGYETVTVAEVVALAGVSKRAFYRHFDSKEDCFLATFGTIVARGAAAIEAAHQGAATGARGRLTAAAEAFVTLAVEEAPAARLVFLASLDLGAAAVEARGRASRRLERMLARSLAEAAGGAEPSPLAVRGVVGGAEEVVYRRLRDGAPEDLRAEIPALVGWALGYRHGEAEVPSPGRRLVAGIEPRGGRGAGDAGDADEEMAGWERSPRDRRARQGLSQRERIMRATAQAVAAEGYAALSVAAISGRAGVSNQTFYANFASKEEAFLDALDALALIALERTGASLWAREGRLRSSAAGMVTLLRHFADSPLHSRLVFVELEGAGPEARARSRATLDLFIGFLEPEGLPATERPPRAVLEAVAGGLVAIVRGEVLEGRGDVLAALAPELIDFALRPFGVREETQGDQAGSPPTGSTVAPRPTRSTRRAGRASGP